MSTEAGPGGDRAREEAADADLEADLDADHDAGVVTADAEGTRSLGGPDPDEGPDEGDDVDDGDDPDVGWWHRDHPVFVALAGFFTGLVTVIVVPGAYAAVLNAMLSLERAEDLFPYVLVILAVPLGLTASPRTRRFGRYMLLGMVLTAVVVAGVAALVLWVLVRVEG